MCATVLDIRRCTCITSFKAFTKITKGAASQVPTIACHLWHADPLLKLSEPGDYRYVRSTVDAQLGGENKAPNTLGQCEPQQYVNNQENFVYNGVALPDNAGIDPCGLLPHSYFNDSFTLSQQQPGAAVTNLALDVNAHTHTLCLCPSLLCGHT